MNNKIGSLTPRLLKLIESSSRFTKNALYALGKDFINQDDAKSIIQRLSVIDARSLLLLACLNVEEITADFSEINLDDEIEFMIGSEEFIAEIVTILDGDDAK